MSSDSEEEDQLEYTVKEVKEIEEELNKKEEVKENIVEVNEEEDKAKERPSEKDELIDQIMKCQEQIKKNDKNFKSYSRSTLKRYGIPRLQKVLGELVNHGITKTFAVPEAKADRPPLDPGAEMVANGLFQFNMMFASMTEQLTMQFPSPVVIDKGFSENLLKQKNDLLCYYKAIYYEHKQILDQYISPVNMIILINCNAVLPAIKSRNQMLLEQAKNPPPLTSEPKN